MLQTIRFVGGPYHGRTQVVKEEDQCIAMAVLNNRPDTYFDGTLRNGDKPLNIVEARYYRTWLSRSTPMLRVDEQVMVYEPLLGQHRETSERWQELRAL